MSRRSRHTAIIGLFLALSTLSAAAAPLAIPDLLAAPFPEQLRAAPAGGAVAWVANDRGVANIWVAEPPGYQARQLTSYRHDDGAAIGQLDFTRDGKSLIYSRRPEPDGSDPGPSPLTAALGVRPVIWQVSLAGDTPKKLTNGGFPLVSPNGREIVFFRGEEAWTKALDKKGDEQRLFEARGSTRTVRFAPDGSAFAFVSERDRHSFVGVYDAKVRGVRWLDPSVDTDDAPIWSPDGTEVAFLRLPARTEALPFFADREGEPWSIRAVEVATGKARTLFRALPGRGSVYRETASPEQLAWLADGRVVFPWERDGWLHLYAIEATAPGEPRLLTPGAFEVEQVTPAADRRSLLVASNQGDIDRRHLWRVRVGEAPAALTTGEGIEWSPAETADGAAIALLRSDARHPARPALLRGGTLTDLTTEPAGFPSAELVVPQAVIVPAADGLPLHGQLFLPKDLAPGEHRPAVAFFHGGSQRQMLLGWHYLDYYHKAYALNQALASRGYVVLSVNYRSGIGYGLEFREAQNYGAEGGSELADVLGTGLYLRGRGDVDPARIGLWGGSYGGYLTAMGLAHASDLFAAGVDLHGVTDWNVVVKNFAPTYERLADPERTRKAVAASPIAAMAGWRSPVLLIHGDDDRNVPFSESVDLAIALRKQGVPFEQLIFPDDVHDFLLHTNWIRAYEAALDFFARKLRPSA